MMKFSAKENSVTEIVRYHEETKHHFDRYARSAGRMDWDNQPHPFRFYDGVATVSLPFLTEDPTATYEDLYRRDIHAPQEITLAGIAGVLELSLGLSAWKAAGGSRWALRINPSSGNLHPTEAHLIVPRIEGLEGGVYHYSPLRHALEQRAIVPDNLGEQIAAHFGSRGFLVGLSSIFWRESWKYGERAFRYCNHDIGHAVATFSLAANLVGWKASYLAGLSDRDIHTVLGFDKTRFAPLEEEHPDLMCWVHPDPCPGMPDRLNDDIMTAFGHLVFRGRPNRLSRRPVNWEIIYHAARLTGKPAAAAHRRDTVDPPGYRDDPVDTLAAKVIRRCRSATAFDSNASLTRDQLLGILDETLPRRDRAPFDAHLGEAHLHLLLFAHRVEGLSPGLYFLIRSEHATARLRRLTRSHFAWQPVAGRFPLFLLQKGDYRQQAMMVSCHQEIAGHSAFSLGMISAFRAPVSTDPSAYRRLFWESGMVGQVLYLAAEARGLRGTGIGCFFDDAVHDLLGLNDNQYQSLYHFTIGKPLEDPRLTTYPPYDHLKNR